MKNYYVDKVNVIINGSESVIEVIAGSGYDLNVVKRVAIKRAKGKFPYSEKFTAVLISHEEYTYEEYKTVTGSNPGWIIDK